MRKDISDMYRPLVGLIVYESGANYYLETHAIRHNKNNRSYELGPGKPMEKTKLVGFAQTLIKSFDERLSMKTLIPSNVLYINNKIGNECLVWYSPPGAHTMFFIASLGIPSGIAQSCGLVFVSNSDSQLSVYAVKGTCEDISETLYIAPFHNVHLDGRICLGSARKDKVMNVEVRVAIKSWEQAFWDSMFTHLSHTEKIIEGNLNLLWMDLISDITKPFPTDVLVPHKKIKTLGMLIDTL